MARLYGKITKRVKRKSPCPSLPRGKGSGPFKIGAGVKGEAFHESCGEVSLYLQKRNLRRALTILEKDFEERFLVLRIRYPEFVSIKNVTGKCQTFCKGLLKNFVTPIFKNVVPESYSLSRVLLFRIPYLEKIIPENFRLLGKGVFFRTAFLKRDVSQLPLSGRVVAPNSAPFREVYRSKSSFSGMVVPETSCLLEKDCSTKIPFFGKGYSSRFSRFRKEGLGGFSVLSCKRAMMTQGLCSKARWVGR